MAEQGAPPMYVQMQLGHSSIQVTMDIYSHLFPNGNREWVAKLDGGGEVDQSATQAQPGTVVKEQPSDKPLENMVAVSRIERETRGL